MLRVVTLPGEATPSGTNVPGLGRGGRRTGARLSARPEMRAPESCSLPGSKTSEKPWGKESQ